MKQGDFKIILNTESKLTITKQPHMNIKSTSLRLVGVCVSMGAIFSLAPINPVQAGSFNRDIMDVNGYKMGRMAFTWDDGTVTDSMLKGFDSLTSFSLMNYGGMSYDLDFVKNAHFKEFNFNITDGELNTYAFERTRATKTRRYGFDIKTQDFNSDLIAASVPASIASNDQSLDEALETNRYIVNLDLSQPLPPESNITPGPATISSDPTTVPFMSNNARFVPAEVSPAQTVPENSLTTALLIIAGLVFLSPNKIF